MMITLNKADILEAIEVHLSDTVAMPPRLKKKLTWYINSLNEPWRLEVEIDQEEGNE